MKNWLKRCIGDKAFYKMVLVVILPMMIQQGIASFVSLLDNIMVGGLGTESISSVAIVNQIIMIFNLAIFGGLSGASIFGAQYFGKGDMDGMRHTFRFKLYFSVAVIAIGVTVYAVFGETFIGMFLQGESGSGDPALTLQYAREYMYISLIGLIPFALSQAYVSTLREAGETVAPMIASVTAVIVNLVFNWLLIYGNLGCPKLGVAGAAYATVLSRYVELAIVVIHAHVKARQKYPFVKGVYRSLYVPGELVGKIARTGSPLLINEIFWSFGMTVINQSYSLRGIDALAALNIVGTAWNLFSIIFMAMGNAVAIFVGQKLGAGDIQGAKEVDRKLIFMSVALNTVIGILLACASGVIPLLYNIDPAVRALTTKLIIVAGISMPIHAYLHVVYFTIRSGGKTVITFLFDCGYTWAVPVTLAYCLCRFTSWHIIAIYACVQFIDIGKAIVGALMLRSDFWANNVVDTKTETEGTEAAV